MIASMYINYDNKEDVLCGMEKKMFECSIETLLFAAKSRFARLSMLLDSCLADFKLQFSTKLSAGRELFRISALVINK